MTLSPALIREAVESDLPRISEIYNDSILRETASFHTEARSAEQMRQWFGRHGPKHPVLVATSEPGNGVPSRVIGWACLSPWDERCGYATTAEFTFYVDPEFRGQGIGRALLAELDRRAPVLGLRTIISRVVEESFASIALHESFGFTRAGRLQQVGSKFGRWLDVIFFQKIYSR